MGGFSSGKFTRVGYQVLAESRSEDLRGGSRSRSAPSLSQIAMDRRQIANVRLGAFIIIFYFHLYTSMLRDPRLTCPVFLANDAGSSAF